MKTIYAAVVIAASLMSGLCAAEEKATPAAALSERERVDYLLKQNQMLMEENQRLKALAGRPRSKEENFAVCMQAARGETSAMAAESIGGHCDQLLKH
ncbi:hypothetical protein [Rugamonas sp.]|uniref:hypothetical protein n=1 Tax=Rugamonas sp. TaxID=1926287 RepID=UPI0025E55372|nr:hypothetical protein [Rugamonas sp.]